jgi:flagellar hook protein FlgE
MASYTALNTAFSGMNVNARNLDVIGNNIANANTNAFKSSRMLFEPMFYRTFNMGGAPADNFGGSNPTQVGLGATIAGTQQDFRTGSITPTGDPRDLAIDGKGFFVVQRGGDTLYTRNGAFRQDADGQLVTIDGSRVQGYRVDSNFNIIPGILGDIDIPVGRLSIAQATREVRFTGNFDADGVVATRGTNVRLGGLPATGLRLVPGATVPPPPGSQLAPGSLLREIEDPLASGSGTPLFGVGQSIELRNVSKGGRVIPTTSLPISASTTVQDLMSFFSNILGLRTNTGVNPDGNQPGVSLDAATGFLTIHGNTGQANDLEIDPGDIRLLGANGTLVRSPFDVQTKAKADGESVRTAFVAYNSLGSPTKIDAAVTLISRGPAGTQWRYDLDQFQENATANPNVATGTLQFDEFGVIEAPGPITLSLNQSASGALSPQAVSLVFAGTPEEGGVSALADVKSSLASSYQDGSPIGTLAGYGTDENGLITGTFTNGLSRTLGRVAIATFVNIEGLIDEGGHLFHPGPNSGPAAITDPGDLGTGTIVGGALELSNVDLGSEFIKLIQTSTGYSANTRVIRTTDELMQQLLTLGR